MESINPRAILNQKIIEAAKISLKNNGIMSVEKIASERGLARVTVSNARILVEYATQEEMESVMTGAIGIRPMADIVRRRLTHDDQQRLRARSGYMPDTHLYLLKHDAELWAKLGKSLVSLSSMPKPEDMISVVRRNGHRANSVNHFLNTATKWLTEFAHEWSRSQNNKHKDNCGDAG